MISMSETEILPGPPPCEIHHRFARVNGVRLHYVEAHPTTARRDDSNSGRLCLLLHGFPEFWYSWRRQIPALAAAGFHVLAPDLRGYNLSDKPPGVSSYRIDTLVGDVIGLIAHAGEEKAAIIGHDWGGVVAWQLAMHHPQTVEKLVILNAAHPAAYLRELRSWRQLLKSWYIFFFQLPALPELLIRFDDYDGVARSLHHQPVHREAFGPEDIRRYKEALGRPGALTAALNYYRAAVRSLLKRGTRVEVSIRLPVLLLWGERDAYATPRLTEGLNAWVPNLRIVRFLDASHWIQNDVPERVNRLIIDFLLENKERG